MTVVVEDLDLPNSQTPYAQVDITLAGNDCVPVFGYHSVTHAVVGTLQLKPGRGIDADGVWEADLVPNSLITPAGTSYRIVRRTSDGSKWVTCVQVPVVTGGEAIPVSQLPQDTPEGIDPLALALHEDDLFAHGEVHEVSWWSSADWDRFTRVVASNVADSNHVLTVDNGEGVVTGSPGGNDRFIYFLDGTESLTDVEAYVDIELSGASAQGGLALSGDDDTAIILWTNILLANAVLIPGIWEYDGTNAGLDTNQQSPTLDGFKSSVASANGDGATLEVHTVRPHYLTPGQIVHFDASFGSFGQFTVASIVDETTFTVASTTGGQWTGGTVRMLFLPSRFKLAARRVGNVLTYKHWLPGQEEPAWDDTLKAATITLPTSLAGGGTLPGAGKLGLLAAHLNGTVRFSNLRIRDLTRSNTWPATDDQQLHSELGLLTARVDSLLPHNSPDPNDQNMVAWAFDIGLAAGGTAPANGDAWATRLMIREPVTVDTVYFAVTVADSDPVAGQCQLALYDSAGQRLHAAVDLASIVTAAGLKTVTIPATLVVPPFVWAGIVVNFTTGGTFAMLRGTSSLTGGSLNAGLTAAKFRWGRINTGLTALPASFTPSTLVHSTAGATWWFGLAI